MGGGNTGTSSASFSWSSVVRLSKGWHVLLKAEPFGMGRVQDVLLVLRVFGRRGPLATSAPFPECAGCGGQGLRARVMLPQPRVGHTLSSSGPIFRGFHQQLADEVYGQLRHAGEGLAAEVHVHL